MEAKAKVQFVRISPRKVKIVLDLVRGKDVATAAAILKHTPKAASEYVYKLVKSAAANAEHNFGMVCRDRTPKPSFAAVAFLSRAVGAFERAEEQIGRASCRERV